MSWFSIIAIFFVLWWIVLFAAIPFSMRTQGDDGDVTLGTDAGAPRGPHMLRAFIRTTIASLIIFGVLYVIVYYFGFRFEDIPRVVPDYQ